MTMYSNHSPETKEHQSAVTFIRDTVTRRHWIWDPCDKYLGDGIVTSPLGTHIADVKTTSWTSGNWIINTSCYCHWNDDDPRLLLLHVTGEDSFLYGLHTWGKFEKGDPRPGKRFAPETWKLYTPNPEKFIRIAIDP